MRMLFVLILGICLPGSSTAAGFDPFAGPKPLLVFIQSDPWATVMGSDTPRVVVYESGEVIFAKRTREGFAYYHVTLGREGLDNLRKRVKSVLSNELKPLYDVRPGWTDQPIAMFYFRDGAREVTTSVYGLQAPGDRSPAYAKGAKVTMPPKGLLELHEWLCKPDYRNSRIWTPKYVEVVLWDYSYAPQPSIQWLRTWPGLHSDHAIRRGDQYSIFLDGAQLPRLTKFLATRRDRGAVEVDGKKMALSWRYTLPSEPIWRSAFAKEIQAAQ